VKIKEADLPGIGRKYSMELVDGKALTLIIHHSGKREVYVMDDPDADEPESIVVLTDDEARKFGSILAGSDYQPVTDERLELLLNNLFVEWLKVGENSLFANFTIRETRMKNVFDVTIIGIQRGEDIIGSPSADEMILPGDLLMVVGKREKIKNLEHLCLQEKLCQISAGWKA